MVECSLESSRHANNLLTLENKRLHRQLEIQREITKEWERRFDKLLDGVKVAVVSQSTPDPAPRRRLFIPWFGK